MESDGAIMYIDCKVEPDIFLVERAMMKEQHTCIWASEWIPADIMETLKSDKVKMYWEWWEPR